MVRIISIAIVLAFSNISQAWSAAPIIQVWYNYSGANPDIAFGLPGRTQRWINVLGNVQSDAGIASLTYNINGGPERSLSFTPFRRLVDYGDFNVEVNPNDSADPFFAGANAVNLKATDNDGVVSTKTVTVDYEPGSVWPYPYTVDWQSTTTSNIESIAHVVDGKWERTANGIRTIQTGYDRMIAIGDWTWSTNNVSVTVPFTIHTDFRGIGSGMGWREHTGWVKPRKGWAGTYAWVRGPLSNPELDIMLYDPVQWEVVVASKPVSIALNTPYLLKSYIQPVNSTTSNFCIKLWPQASSEPANWDLCSNVPYRDGSVNLVANDVDATFGNVSIGPLSATPPPADTTAPIISNVQATPTSTGATVTWATNEASDSAVDYGTPSLGPTASSATRVTSHSINLTGLASSTTYQYRVRSKDASNNERVDSIRTFTTLAPPPTDTTAPVISNVQATPTSTGATVTWATNEASDSAVDYGTPSLGPTASSATRVTSHSINLTGLASNTTYQYRVRSKDASNNERVDSIRTFTTAAAGSASGMVSDNFNGPSLNTALWTVRDLKGDGVVSVDGNRLLLSVPGGVVSHDLWVEDGALAVAQDISNNTDFTVDVRFDSPVTARYQTQGIRVAGTTGYIRSEFHHDGTTVRAYAATIINGTRTKMFSRPITLGAPMYIRLARSGDLWTMRYSANGTDWVTAGTFTQAFVPTEAGPYAGNNGSPAPQHTALVNDFIVAP